MIKEIKLYNVDGIETKATVELNLLDAAQLLAECSDDEQARFMEVFAVTLLERCGSVGKYIFQLHWMYDSMGKQGREMVDILAEKIGGE